MDSHLMAAFLAGTLSPKERQEAVVHLIQHREAREVLCMAVAALRVALRPERRRAPHPLHAYADVA